MSQKEYKKQQSFCVNLLKNPKKDHFENFAINFVSDNKTLWHICKTIFSSKVKTKEQLSNYSCNSLLGRKQ